MRHPAALIFPLVSSARLTLVRTARKRAFQDDFLGKMPQDAVGWIGSGLTESAYRGIAHDPGQPGDVRCIPRWRSHRRKHLVGAFATWGALATALVGKELHQVGGCLACLVDMALPLSQNDERHRADEATFGVKGAEVQGQIRLIRVEDAP